MGSSPAYPSDLTDAQWALIEPLVPVRSTRGKGTRGGRPPKFPRRRIVDAILYLDRTGCSWRQLPHDFPPRDTVYFSFQRWVADGTVDRIHAALRDAVRDAAGRDPRASAGAVDSQTVPGGSTVGRGSRGWDAGKKTNGRQRHLLVDTMGLLIVVLVTAASVADRDGAIRVLDRAKIAMPSLVLVWADAADSRRAQQFAARALRITVQVVAKLVGQSGFVPLPRRWVVERTHAWITGHRRMSRDYERLPAHSQARIKWAMIGLMAGGWRRHPAAVPGNRHEPPSPFSTPCQIGDQRVGQVRRKVSGQRHRRLLADRADRGRCHRGYGLSRSGKASAPSSCDTSPCPPSGHDQHPLPRRSLTEYATLPRPCPPTEVLRSSRSSPRRRRVPS